MIEILSGVKMWGKKKCCMGSMEVVYGVERKCCYRMGLCGIGYKIGCLFEEFERKWLEGIYFRVMIGIGFME